MQPDLQPPSDADQNPQVAGRTGGGAEPIYVESASAVERLASAFLVACFAAVTAIAYHLPVDPTGTGTHTRLGLPPCGLYDKFGIPCMSCGWTTSWAAVVKLRVLEALRASPFGTLLWTVLAAGAAVNAWSVASGWPFFRFVERLNWVRIGLATLVLMTASWIYKILACLL